LRQIAMATLAYAAENNGSLPPRCGANNYPFPSASDAPYAYTSIIFTPGAANSQPTACNIGMLMVKGFIGSTSQDAAWMSTKNPKTGLYNYCDTSVAPVRFDPALPVGDLALAEASPPNNTAEQNFVYASSYLYNPHWALTSIVSTWPSGGTATFGSQVSWYTKVGQYSPYKALACDMVWNWTTVAHHTASSVKFNLAFIDGHVSTVNDTKAMYHMYNGGTPAPSWPGVGSGQPYGTNAPLMRMDDDIDILEAEADGRDPETSPGDLGATLYIYNSSGGVGSATYQPFVYRVQKGSSSAPYPVSTSDNATNHPLVPWL
jgi:prepilin-type processing-associated H-X9-DG protein